jgi:hypothetical protein
MAKIAPSIVVEGLDELRRGLRQVQDHGLNDALKAANKHIAKEIVDLALPNVPVGKTGRLKASVRALGNLSGAVGKAGSARVPYAAAIHWGRSEGNLAFKTGKYSKGQGIVQGRPFLWEASKSLEPEVADIYQREVLRILDTVRAR